MIGILDLYDLNHTLAAAVTSCKGHTHPATGEYPMLQAVTYSIIE